MADSDNPGRPNTLEGPDVVPHSNIHEALAAAYRQVRTISMSTSSGVNYKFVGHEQLIAAVRPAFEKHGIMMYPAKVEDVTFGEYLSGSNKVMHRTQLTVTYAFAHISGTQIEVQVQAESADTGDKGTAQAMTMAAKTALRQTMLVSGDKDPDEEKNEMGRRDRGQPSAAPTGDPMEMTRGDFQNWFWPRAKELGLDKDQIETKLGRPLTELGRPELIRLVESRDAAVAGVAEGGDS